MMTYYLISAICAYLLGSIPTAVWIGKARYGIDVREHGSKNAGATNTFRVLGKKPGIVVLLIDVAKGALAVSIPLIILHFTSDSLSDQQDSLQIVAAIFAVLGHIFPLFAGFRGGKGVATSLGIIIGMQPLSAAICFGVFLIVFVVSKFVSLGAIVASVCFPIIVYLLHPDAVQMQIFSFILGTAVILAHRKNIKRLIKGEESKMNLFKK
jgi:acyl phosphate:glycerol-3-phosphate acyltransferase